MFGKQGKIITIDDVNTSLPSIIQLLGGEEGIRLSGELASEGFSDTLEVEFPEWMSEGGAKLIMDELRKNMGDSVQLIAKSVWSTAYINTFPDSSFAYVEEGEKDESGRTTPRSKRHLPYKDANGKVDAAHVRNALQRLEQTQIPDSAKASARSKLEAAAKGAGVKVSKSLDQPLYILCLKKVECEHVGGEIQKPFGEWENFAACKLDMMKQGHTEEEASKICGKLQSQSETNKI